MSQSTPRSRGSARVVLAGLAPFLALGWGVAVPVHGQSQGEAPVSTSRVLSADSASSQASSRWWKGLRGIREPDRVYGGLWALHLRRPGDGLSSHHLIGGTYRGVHAGSFVNTHQGRSWMLALGRTVIAGGGTRGAFRLGYRVGLLAGYDEQLTDLAGRWPVLPAGKLVADARYRRLGFQVGWAWIVVTLGGFVELGGG